MEIQINIFGAEFKKQSAWFIQVEVEETSFPSKLKTKQKQRTDLSTGFSLKFDKNYFIFKASLSNRISIKFGAIEVLSESQKIDPSKCNCEGLYTLVITKRMLAALRDQVAIKELYKLLHPSSKKETCLLTVSISLNFYGIEEKIIENQRTFMKVEYDRYENDNEVITEKLVKVEELLEIKTKELEEWMNKVDHIKNALRSLGGDVAMLKKEKDLLEIENNEYNKRIERLSSVDDIHIKVDMLITSPHGVDILKQIFEKIQARLVNQRKIYEDLTENWRKIEGKKRKLEELKEEVRKIKEAQSQLEFHHLTLKDQLPQALVLRGNVKALDSLIKDFEKQIAKARTIKKDKGIEVEVAELKHKHGILLEKQKQVQIVLESNQGYLPLEELEKLQIDKYDEDPESQELKNRGEALLKEIEELGLQFSKESVKTKETYNPIELQVKLQAAEARVEAMQSRMSEQTTLHAKELAKYETQLALLDAQIGKFD